MRLGQHTPASVQPPFGACTKGYLHLVRGLSGLRDGCRRRGLRLDQAAGWQRTRSVGAGPAFAATGRAALLARSCRPSFGACRCKPPRRCALGAGGRPALHIACRRDRRAVGRSAHARLYRDQAACDAGGTLQGALLADPAGSLARSECGPQPMARCVPALAGPSGRHQGTGRSAVAGGTVPFAPAAARHMGRDL